MHLPLRSVWICMCSWLRKEKEIWFYIKNVHMKLRLNVTSFCFMSVLCEGGGGRWHTLFTFHISTDFRGKCAQSQRRVLRLFVIQRGWGEVGWTRMPVWYFSTAGASPPPPPLILTYLLPPAKNMITWSEMHEDSCGARLLTIILIIPTGAWTRTARNLKKMPVAGWMTQIAGMREW